MSYYQLTVKIYVKSATLFVHVIPVPSGPHSKWDAGGYAPYVDVSRARMQTHINKNVQHTVAPSIKTSRVNRVNKTVKTT